MKKLHLSTPSLAQKNIQKLAQIFPNVVKEGKVDFELLKQMLSDHVIDGCKERYGLNWVGKKESILKVNTPINKTLRPVIEKSVEFEKTKNLYIEGDNFEALKIIQESYLGKVKMIYIDPPYNTGKDFIYKDNFKQSKDEYEEEIEAVDEDGVKLFKNTDSNGRFHSDWLSMMYERLLIAKDLLRVDGVIFISIDDHEVHNLRHLCDEVFGEKNYIQEIIWEKKYSPQNDAKYFSLNHEQIICYAKNKEKFNRNLLPMTEEQKSRYKNPDNDPRGPWKSSDLSVARKTEKDIYEIITPSGRTVLPPPGRSWSVSKQKFEELLKDNRIWFGENGNNVQVSKDFYQK
ncbi:MULTISPECIES: site-specific DNA-methyltransferase [unclassified Nitratiruptor]|uniref:site-specific DNA-methyltransferase n=1 Tax=unclassified Nitratiruptor TaxID=2624044 RepID=UPI001915A993|nr:MULTISPECIES: site-specific DNA-methyltransferase [unclassified Nitratiruptor]BCD59341.1 adenine-specific DNA-methyltransferase [Nitratiruptor sp. YY08-10]BCD63265.1 adenine-specific DNA-methyltransferase [Nitratiruptor sp. YY08-14]